MATRGSAMGTTKSWWMALGWVVTLSVTPPLSGQSSPPVPLAAYILDAETESGLLGAVIELSGVAQRFVTDVNGHVAFEMAVGEYTLTIRKGGYETLQGGFTVIRPGEFTLKLRSANLDDPAAPARLLGKIVDAETGRPIEGAAVSLLEGGAVATSSRGTFEFSDLTPQIAQVTVEMLGYASRTEPVALHPGQTTALDITLAVEAVELEPIKVVVRSRFLEMHGVYRRMERTTTGRMLMREEIEQRGSIRISDSFAQVPGLRIRRDNKRSILLGRANCPLQIYLDGIEFQTDIEGTVDIDQIPPDWVEVAEVYNGVAATPVEFGGVANHCGAVLIWTRQRARS